MRLENASNRNGAPAKPAADGRGVRNILSHGVSEIVPDEHMSHCGCGIVYSLQAGRLPAKLPIRRDLQCNAQEGGSWGSECRMRF